MEAPNLSSHHVHNHHHLMDWLEDSITFLPTFINEPYVVPDEVAHYDWWSLEQNQTQDQIQASVPATATPVASASAKPEPLPETPKSEVSKKRKLASNPTAGPRQRVAAESQGEFEEERKPTPPLLGSGKKGYGRGNSSGGGGAATASAGGSKEVRWAEQLLNPLAAAIDAANLSRVQHLLYVLQELASPTGDANHRLAFYGLHAISRHLSNAGLSVPGGSASTTTPPPAFATVEPRLFRSALIKFHEVSPWFAFPNCLANAAILQVAVAAAGGRAGPGRTLHVVDVGVSHGLQWPTLLEALSRRAGAAVGTVRITVPVGWAPAAGPFAAAPAGYDFGPHLMRYAKSIDLNLRVERADTAALRRSSVGKETLVVCVQFRAGRAGPGFVRMVREMEPDLVVVVEMEGGGWSGEGWARGFERRAEVVWRFLESTSAAFKGKDCEERRVVESEAARWLEEEEGWGGQMSGGDDGRCRV
ncbi:hypothetical protein HPP92_026028 [Vanilla planifolia]|uniref:Nodulation signaling pathway 1-like protein n=1 Tax=Vanilla planifolia TaxID=51239 RepID=A0A835PG41_VANPL|nr:hypothetical protein HPP92_026303 [Vanilla planifolia]KAG0451770.1 hypothetical protein HPP92_026028 [Vanilla planifolia]